MIQVDIQKQLNGASGNFTLDLKATFQPNKLYAVFGESGCGKTTFFKMLSGIVNPDSGIIIHNNQTLFDKTKKINIPTWKRNIGFVFQNYALFPHLSVYKNIIFGLDKAMQSQVDSLIELLNLAKLCDKKPKNLSGGQAQKVALARSILQNPKILLLDEPFSGLDQNAKNTLQQELKNTLKHFDFTTFLISHDITEVFLLADQVFMLENGAFLRQGTPQEVFLTQQSGENKVYGKILSIKKQDSLAIMQVLIQQTIFKIVLQNPCKDFAIGDCIAIENNFSAKILQNL